MPTTATTLTVPRAARPAPRLPQSPTAAANLGRVTLCDINTVRAILGRTAEAVRELVDAGGLLWVWDLTSREDAGRRALRFLYREVAMPESVRAYGEAEAIAEAIGAHGFREVSIGTLEFRWLISRQQIERLLKSEDLIARQSPRARLVSVASATALLQRRLVK